MDEKRPKRRKDKYNPYSISKEDGRYFLFFKDGQGVPHHYEIDRPLFDLFDSFELEDISYLNVLDRNIEHSELTDASLSKRAFQKPASVEDTVIHAVLTELLHKSIAELPETQRRRLCLYYFAGLTYEQIAEIDECTKMAVKYTIDKAKSTISRKLKILMD